MMSSGCRFSVDARSPARATYVNLYQWPESDVEFINSMTSTTVEGGGGGGGGGGRDLCSSSRKRRYSSRQMYLRSYVFTTKPDTVPRRCLGKFKKQASLLLLGGDDVDQIKCTNYKIEKKKKKKGCAVVVRRMKEAARSLFGRLLPCTANVVPRRSDFG